MVTGVGAGMIPMEVNGGEEEAEIIVKESGDGPVPSAPSLDSFAGVRSRDLRSLTVSRKGSYVSPNISRIIYSSSCVNC